MLTLPFFLLALALPSQGDACRPLFEEAAAAVGPAVAGTASADLRDLLRLSRRARACYADAEPAQRAELYNYETYALSALQRYDEAREAFDVFFRTLLPAADSSLKAKMYARSGFVAKGAGDFTRMQA
ncbi:MAG: hypothetical protein R3362_05910, partial [Rhodothermales bacterium]|nr:hypothetical protein [Rhodothermales bacterium]